MSYVFRGSSIDEYTISVFGTTFVRCSQNLHFSYIYIVLTRLVTIWGVNFSFGFVYISFISEPNEFWSGISCSFSVCEIFMVLWPGIILRFLSTVTVLQYSSWYNIVRLRSFFRLHFFCIFIYVTYFCFLRHFDWWYLLLHLVSLPFASVCCVFGQLNWLPVAFSFKHSSSRLSSSAAQAETKVSL